MNIRPGTVSDLEQIKACAEAAYEGYIDRIGKKPAPMVADFLSAIHAGHLWTLADQSGPKGFVVFYPRGDHMHLENLVVHPSMQGQGLGRKLIAFVEEAARSQNLNAVELYTNAKMVENLTYYPHLGYEQKGRRTEDGFDRVFFRKSLFPQ